MHKINKFEEFSSSESQKRDDLSTTIFITPLLSNAIV
jgi:hypothetical protein